MQETDSSKKLHEQIAHAQNNKTSLRITAGNSKSFYGRKVDGEEISITDHNGIIEYRASELVITARSGTKMSEIENALAEQNQMFAFEPPCHNENSTLGGIIA
ncbi:MAG: FAD-binding protein, partial [Gammaproteobacteria bacterium]|nr:FAD-binding protein [Gammaproteobacteria bacterium]